MEISNDEKYYISFIKDNFLNSKKDLKNLNILDIGCNKGFYTEYLLNIFNGGNYKLFDPSERFIKLVSNKFKNIEKIKIFNLGVSDEDNDYVNFYELEDNNDEVEGMSSLTNRKVFSNFKLNLKKIKTIKLDTFIYNYDIKHVDFIKIDTEGQELKILKGMSKALEYGIVDFIQIEYGDCSIENGFNLFDILNFIEKFDYRIMLYLNGELIEISLDNCEKFTKLPWVNFLIRKNGV